MIKSNVIILFWTHFFQGRQSTVKYLEVNEIKTKKFRFPGLRYFGLLPKKLARFTNSIPYFPVFHIFSYERHPRECNARMATCGLTGPPTRFLATCPRPLPSTPNPVALTSSPTLLLPHINVPSNLKTTTLLSYAMQQILLLRCVPPSPTQNSLTNHLFVSSAINFQRCRNRWTKHD